MTCSPPAPPPSPHLCFGFHSSEKRVRTVFLRVGERILHLIAFREKKKKEGGPLSSSLNTCLGLSWAGVLACAHWPTLFPVLWLLVF